MFGSVVMFFRLMAVPILMEVFVGIMKMHMSLSKQLAEEVVDSEKKESPSGDAGKPGTDAVADYHAK